MEDFIVFVLWLASVCFSCFIVGSASADATQANYREICVEQEIAHWHTNSRGVTEYYWNHEECDCSDEALKVYTVSP